MKKRIKVIGFDVDDTLWVNEPYFRKVEYQFCDLLSDFMKKDEIIEKLFETEMNNLSYYGYGIKSFTLSMIETAIKISEGKVSQEVIAKIIGLSKEMLSHDVELLDGVKESLEEISKYNYKLILATKGDLLDQERKLEKSGLANYFHHIEIMSEKNMESYAKLFKHLDVNPSEFLMIGNSLKSDVLPVIKLGGYAIHVPYHTTWLHEELDYEIESDRYFQLDSIKEIKDLINNYKILE